MVCPQCEHVFRIKDTIPNMVRQVSPLFYLLHREN